MDRWSERNQERAEKANQVYSDDPNWEKRNAATPGPEWAHATVDLPVIGFVGLLVITVETWRERRRRRA